MLPSCLLIPAPPLLCSLAPLLHPGPQPGLHQPVRQRLGQVEPQPGHQPAVEAVDQRVPTARTLRRQQPLGEVRPGGQRRHVERDQRPAHGLRLSQRQRPGQRRVEDALIAVGRHVAVLPAASRVPGDVVGELAVVALGALRVGLAVPRSHHGKRERVAPVAGQRQPDVGQPQQQHDGRGPEPPLHRGSSRPRASSNPATSRLSAVRLIAAPTSTTVGR